MFETYQREDGMWDWRLVDDGNHKIVATSGGQGFRDETDAKRAIDNVITEASRGGRNPATGEIDG